MHLDNKQMDVHSFQYGQSYLLRLLKYFCERRRRGRDLASLQVSLMEEIVRVARRVEPRCHHVVDLAEVGRRSESDGSDVLSGMLLIWHPQRRLLMLLLLLHARLLLLMLLLLLVLVLRPLGVFRVAWSFSFHRLDLLALLGCFLVLLLVFCRRERVVGVLVMGNLINVNNWSLKNVNFDQV